MLIFRTTRALATTGERLRELTGDTFDELSRPGAAMPLAGPNPTNPEDWVQLALNQNARLISSRLGADISRANISLERGGYFPSLDLVVSRSHFESESDITGTSVGQDDTDQDDTTISLQVTVPIFTSGATSSRVRQAEFRHIAARERLDRTARETERETRDAISG